MQQDYQQLRRKRQKNYSIFNQQGHIVQVLQRGRTKRHIQTAIGLMSDRKCCLLHESILDFCSSQPSMVNWLSSPIFPCLFVRSFVCPAMVTSFPSPPPPSSFPPLSPSLDAIQKNFVQKFVWSEMAKKLVKSLFWHHDSPLPW